MGYVLPVESHQYKDYQNRITKDKPNPFYIERPYRPILEVQYQDIANEYSVYDAVLVQQKQYKGKYDLVYAELTGKGKYFSGSI
ncbi:hypothetical protein ACFQ3N_20245 [Virgibacillus byunsanensis]|uniref:Uncharacterized protein n=1 Tax=Virgibacillus byunsanensis TaxID=570945 RepID=A0ABW3LQJ0_9BACI